MPTFRQDTKIGGMVPLIKTDDYSDKSVTEKKLADGAITSEKLSKNVKDLLSAATGLPDDLIDSVGSMDSHFKDLSNRFPVKGSDIDVNAVSYDKLDKSLIVGQKGDSERSVMSQGAVSRELESLESNIPVPDEEDLTSIEGENNKLRFSFADRPYSPQNFSGKGYKILRKNIKTVSLAVTKIVVSSAPTSDGYMSFIINGVESHVDVVASSDTTTDKVADKIAAKLSTFMTEYEVLKDASTITLTRKFDGEISTFSSFSAVNTGISCTITDSTKKELRNILTQNMINQPNTIYEIRYDFDLNNETIELQEGCTLKFNGGSFRNGSLKGNNTSISAQKEIIFRDIYILGKWNIAHIYLDWFEVDESENGNNTIIIHQCLNLCNENIQNTVTFPNKTLYIESCVKYGIQGIDERLYIFKLTSNTTLILNSNIKLKGQDKAHYHIFELSNIRNIVIQGSGTIIGDLEEHIGSEGEYGHGIFIGNGEDITISDISINNCFGDGISIDSLFLYDYRDVEKGLIPNQSDPSLFFPKSHSDISKHSKNITINNVKFNKNRRQGISLQCATNVEIKNCKFINTGQINGTSPMYGIDIEPWIKNGSCHNIYIHNNQFINNKGGDIAIYGLGGDNTGNAYNVVIENNTLNSISIAGCNGLFVSNEKIDRFSLLNLCHAVFKDVIFSNPCRIQGGTKEENFEIVFNGCTFNVPKGFSSTDYKGIFHLANFKYGWNVLFTNSQFNLLENLNITTASINSIERFYNCVFNAEGFDVFINSVCTIKYSKIFANSIKLGFSQNEQNYFIEDNLCILTSSNKVFILTAIKEAADITKDIYFINNTIIDDNSEYFINKENREFNSNIYLVSNISTGRARWGGLKNIFKQVVCYNNKSVNPNKIDPEPLEGTFRFLLANKIMQYFNGETWNTLTYKPADAKNQGSSEDRPSNVDIGFIYKDTTLNKLILWEGTKWVNLDGTELTQ